MKDICVTVPAQPQRGMEHPGFADFHVEMFKSKMSYEDYTNNLILMARPANIIYWEPYRGRVP